LTSQAAATLNGGTVSNQWIVYVIGVRPPTTVW
jgi:hypothetical protein